MNGIDSEYFNSYLVSQERSLSYDANHQHYETRPYTPVTQNPETILPRSDVGVPRSLVDSILQDDKSLFQNYDRFLAGKIDQQEFQAGYCKRLLFIWEWVFQFCFWNFPSALQSWYQILENEDVWLWVDGDETRGPSRRLIRSRWTHDGPTDIHSSCILSRVEFQRGVEIVRNRLQQEIDSRAVGQLNPQASSPPWRQRLDQHPNPLFRYAAVVLQIATSDPLQALDSARRIKGRSLITLFKEVFEQFQLEHEQCALPCTRWDSYVSEMRRLGHTCIYRSKYHVHYICILLNFLGVLTPGYPPISIPIPYIFLNCQSCQKARPLLISDIPWYGEEPWVQNTNELTPPAVPSNILRFLWLLWFRSGDTDVQKWILWLASLDDYTRCTGVSNRYGAHLILACLVSPQLDEWMTTDDLSMYRNSNQSCFRSGEIIDFSWQHSNATAMYIPTSDDWKAAEAALSRAEPALQPGQKLPDILATLGVLFHWISTQSVATPLPDIYTFRDLLSNLYDCLEEELPQITEAAVPSDVKSRIVQEECKHCPPVDDVVLDWYIASSALIVPKNEIRTGMFQKCTCELTTSEDVTRVFTNYFLLPYSAEAEIEKVCRALVAIAEEHGYDAGYFLRDPDDSVSGDNESGREPRKRDERITPTTIIIPRKPSKSHQIEAIRTYILNQLRELESATRQIPSLLSGGKQKSSLPWKTLTQILKERGHELENWPAEVPLPGSGSEFCDDNKGIHGLNAKHLRVLYDATQDKEKPLGFRKVGDMVPATVRMEEAARRRAKVREREASEEREAGPSKRRRVNSNGAGPSWDRN